MMLTPKAAVGSNYGRMCGEATKESIRRTVEEAVKQGIKKEILKASLSAALYGGSGIPLDENMNPCPPLHDLDGQTQKTKQSGC